MAIHLILRILSCFTEKDVEIYKLVACVKLQSKSTRDQRGKLNALNVDIYSFNLLLHSSLSYFLQHFAREEQMERAREERKGETYCRKHTDQFC